MRILKHIKNLLLFFYRAFVSVPIYILFIMLVGIFILIQELVCKTFVFAVREYKFVFNKLKNKQNE